MRGEGEVKEVQEVKEIKERNRGVAAFFDLDGTLVSLPSLERRFFRRLRYRGAIPVKNYFFWLWEAMRLAPRPFGAIFRENKMHLRGVATGRAETGDPKSTPGFFCDGLNRVAWHAGYGHAIVLVSGTLEPLAERVARTLEAELATRGFFIAIRVCATRLEETEGRLTGRIIGDVMSGEAKEHAVKAAVLEMKLDLANCYAYGDSADDQWMLGAVGRPFAVNPREELARLARMRAWPVLHWEKEENGAQRHRERREGNGKDEVVCRTQEAENSDVKVESTR